MKFLPAIALLTVLVGCASAQPSAFERGIYNVTTQRVEVVVLRTNVTATATNIVAVPAFIEIPILNPRETVVGGIQTAGQVGATFGLPWLTPVLGLLGGLYAWWAEYRNSRKKKTLTAFGQHIETAREVIKLQPGGVAMEERFMDSIQSEQVKAGVKSEAAEVASNRVDTMEARESAASVSKTV